MAEFLIKAKAHWMDNLTQQQVSALPPLLQSTYAIRSQKGDIICVRPDGWTWGNAEVRPDYIVVKIPGLVLDKDYEYPLLEEVGVDEYEVRAKRKWCIPEAAVNAVVGNSVTITNMAFNTLKVLKTV